MLIILICLLVVSLASALRINLVLSQNESIVIAHLNSSSDGTASFQIDHPNYNFTDSPGTLPLTFAALPGSDSGRLNFVGASNSSADMNVFYAYDQDPVDNIIMRGVERGASGIVSSFASNQDGSKLFASVKSSEEGYPGAIDIWNTSYGNGYMSFIHTTPLYVDPELVTMVSEPSGRFLILTDAVNLQLDVMNSTYQIVGSSQLPKDCSPASKAPIYGSFFPASGDPRFYLVLCNLNIWALRATTTQHTMDLTSVANYTLQQCHGAGGSCQANSKSRPVLVPVEDKPDQADVYFSSANWNDAAGNDLINHYRFYFPSVSSSSYGTQDLSEFSFSESARPVTYDTNGTSPWDGDTMAFQPCDCCGGFIFLSNNGEDNEAQRIQAWSRNATDGSLAWAAELDVSGSVSQILSLGCSS